MLLFKEHYNTYEKASELIDGGNMSNCWSDSKFDVETGEFTPIADPKPTYYGGDDEAPILSKNFDDFSRIDCWQEYSYVFVKDRWEGYAISHKMDENYEEIVSVNVRNVEIPEPETVLISVTRPLTIYCRGIIINAYTTEDYGKRRTTYRTNARRDTGTS